jgi:dTDP-4-dehydrorhamnose reductase
MSKLKGEEVSIKTVDNLYVIRTNIIGDNSQNKGSLFEWANRELIIGNTINGFSNIYFNPLSVQHLSFILLKLQEEKVPFGIYNLGCDRIISKYDFLLEVANLIEAYPSLVKPVEFNPSPDDAKRPMNTTVNCAKIKNQIKNLDLSFQTSLEMLMKSKNEKN